MGFNRKKAMGQRASYDGGEPEYTSGKKSNPHLKGKKIDHKYYSDHGRGTHCDDDSDYKKTSTRKIW